MQEEKEMEPKYDLDILKTYNYDEWFENEELTDKEEYVDLFDMPPLEDDEEVKEGTKIKNVNSKEIIN